MTKKELDALLLAPAPREVPPLIVTALRQRSGWTTSCLLAFFILTWGLPLYVIEPCGATLAPAIFSLAVAASLAGHALCRCVHGPRLVSLGTVVEATVVGTGDPDARDWREQQRIDLEYEFEGATERFSIYPGDSEERARAVRACSDHQPVLALVEREAVLRVAGLPVPRLQRRLVLEWMPDMVFPPDEAQRASVLVWARSSSAACLLLGTLAAFAGLWAMGWNELSGVVIDLTTPGPTIGLAIQAGILVTIATVVGLAVMSGWMRLGSGFAMPTIYLAFTGAFYSLALLVYTNSAWDSTPGEQGWAEVEDVVALQVGYKHAGPPPRFTHYYATMRVPEEFWKYRTVGVYEPEIRAGHFAPGKRFGFLKHPGRWGCAWFRFDDMPRCYPNARLDTVEPTKYRVFSAHGRFLRRIPRDRRDADRGRDPVRHLWRTCGCSPRLRPGHEGAVAARSTPRRVASEAAPRGSHSRIRRLERRQRRIWLSGLAQEERSTVTAWRKRAVRRDGASGAKVVS